MTPLPLRTPLYGGWAPLPTGRSRKWRTGKSSRGKRARGPALPASKSEAAGGENLNFQLGFCKMGSWAYLVIACYSTPRMQRGFP